MGERVRDRISPVQMPVFEIDAAKRYTSGKGSQMIRHMLKSKIHRATVTGVDLNYEGSLAVDAAILRAADILPYERVHVYNITNGERLETYAIENAPGSGTIELRGAAAHKGKPGDLVIIACFTTMNDRNLKDFQPSVVYLDKMNRIKEEK